jgi:hypothetical protein
MQEQDMAGTHQDPVTASWWWAAAVGALAGAAGTAAMTLTEKLEQRFTGRPGSYVPAHTLERLLGLEEKPDADRVGLNHAMHWGTGLIVGAVRGVMAQAGLRGPRASMLMHLPVRLTTDQTLENATGVGAPPWTWPRDERILDTAEKGIYSLVTGLVADALTRPTPQREPTVA